MKNLCLIDGYGFVFRAYHSLPPLLSPDNLPVSAVYGFLNMIVKILKEHQYDHIGVVLDSGKKNFRHDISPEYKAKRPEAPEDLKVQFPIIREAIEALNISVIEQNGFEADDLIASYARNARSNNYKVTVISADKDLMCLMADSGIILYDPVKNRVISKDDVEKKFGVGPEKIVDALSLIGDASDNIKGVKGIGNKTAATLLNTFGSLEEIYDHIDSVTPSRIQNLLIEGRESAFLSKRLVTLDCNVHLLSGIDQLAVKKFDIAMLTEFLSKYGFKSFFHKFGIAQPEPTLFREEEDGSKLSTLFDNQFIEFSDITALLPEIVKYGLITFFISIESFTFFSCNKVYKVTNSKDSDSINSILLTMKSVIEDDCVQKVAANAKDLIHRCMDLAIKSSDIEDLSVIAYTVKMGKYKYDIESLCSEYLDYHCNIDAGVLFLLYKKLKQRLFDEKKLWLYETIDRCLVELVCHMEKIGILVDQESLKRLSLGFKSRLSDLEEEIYKLAGRSFNIASPKQVGEVLFDSENSSSLSLPGFANNKRSKAKKSRKTGNYVVDSNALEELSDSGNKIAPIILKWRQIFKLVTTYTDGLQHSINPITKRLHTTFELTATATGRLSSKNPNLQNIPIKTKDGASIREVFIAKEGCVLLCADYSQIELRLLAHIADVAALKSAFLDGKDVHAITASQIFGVQLEDVTQELRRKAKAVNFGIIYGISAFGLARNLDITKTEADTYITKYFKQYPGIQQYMEKTINFTRRSGFVETLFGRRCYIDGINDKNHNIRQFSERAAINAPLQGTASDIIKKAMVELPSHINKYMVLQVHDELLFEVPENEATEYSAIIKDIMENATKLDVPLVADCKFGKTWGIK